MPGIIASLRALLTGNIAALKVGPVVGLHRALRLACALCFIGHGVWGVIAKLAWLQCYETLGIPEWMAWPLMPIVGTADITLGIAVLFHPCRALLLWMATWSVFTTSLSALAGFGVWEFLGYAGNFGPALAFLLLSTPQQVGWFDKIEPHAASTVVLQRVRWVLQISIALLLVGHGALAAFDRPQVLIEHWTALGFTATATVARWFGGAEILLGLTAFFVTARPFVVGVLYWRLATELLHPIAGSLVDTWGVIERGGDYAAPFALLCVLYLLHNPGLGAVESQTRAAPRADLAHALRVGFATLAFTASLSTAYAWMRVDVREREHYFEDYETMIASGYQSAGWLPAMMPASARFIHEVHDLTSKATLSSFYISDAPEFLGYIGHLHEHAGASTCAPPAALVKPDPHWSSGLERYRRHLQMIAGNDKRSYAYEPDTGQVFSWKCGRGETRPDT